MADDQKTSVPIVIPHQTQEASFSIINTISLLIILGYMAAMPMWMWWPPDVKPETLAILNQMMGAWSMAFGTVLAFHLGSSKGAKEAAQTTRDTLSAMTSTVATTAAAATAAPVAAPVLTNGAEEAKIWNDAVTANTKEAFESYIQKFPAGVHVVEANGRIAGLSNP